MPCTCVPTGSSSGSAGEARRWTCSRPCRRSRRLALDRPRQHPGRHAPPARDDDPHDRLRVATPRNPRADRIGRRPDRAHRPPQDGSRKIVNITEVYGIDDDEILMQDIFEYEQTGIHEGRVEGVPEADRHPTHVHGQVQGRGIDLPPGEFGILRGPEPTERGQGKGRWAPGRRTRSPMSPVRCSAWARRSRPVGWSTSPDRPDHPETGLVKSGEIKDQTPMPLTNLKAKLEAAGSSLDKVAGELVPARTVRVRHLQRGMGSPFPATRRSVKARRYRSSAARASGSRSARSPRRSDRGLAGPRACGWRSRPPGGQASSGRPCCGGRS